MSLASEFPLPGRMGGKLVFERHAVENFKRSLVGLDRLERDAREPITFIDANQVAAELGTTRRTVGRRIAGRVPR